MKLPEYPQQGKPVEQTMREVIDYLRMTTITNFQGGQMKQSRGGTTLSVRNPIRPRMNDAHPHPWKITTVTAIVGASEEFRIYVNYGALTHETWGTDEPSFIEGAATFNATTPTYLLNDPFNTGTVGYFVASVSTDYGVWLKLERVDATSLFDPESLGEIYTGMKYFIHSNAEIFISSTFVNSSDTPTYSGDFSYIYIGKVSYDADGNATIQQRRRSDIVTAVTAYPTGITVVSTDADNSITTGTDGRAFYEAPPIVSADANNSISAGSDGGAFYDDP